MSASLTAEAQRAQRERGVSLRRLCVLCASAVKRGSKFVNQLP